MKKQLARSAVILSLILTSTAPVRADKVLELKSANYNPNTGIWSDSSGNANDAVGGNPPALIPNQTKSL